MIRALLDQGLPRSAARLLRELGWDAEHAGERGLSRAEDAAILALARQEGRVVVTLDADFHALLALSGQARPSVLRIREEGLNGEAIAQLVHQVFQIARDPLLHGALITVVAGKVRIKHLPIARAG